MNKQIKISHKDNNGIERHYTLEFTRKSIAQMERSGFRIDEVMAKPMTSLPTLFAGAFIAHHPGVPRTTVDNIYAKLPKKEELIEVLSAMYNEPINALLEEPDENAEGNAIWEMV